MSSLRGAHAPECYPTSSTSIISSSLLPIHYYSRVLSGASLSIAPGTMRFRGFLYEDVITFRTRSVEGRIKRPRCRYFYDPISRLGLIKHDHHIRALTCRYDQLLVILDMTTCINLIELNVLMNCDLPMHKTGFSKLTELIARNTRLQVISFENINFGSLKTMQLLFEFIDELYSFSRITCIYLTAIPSLCLNTRERKESRTRQGSSSWRESSKTTARSRGFRSTGTTC